MAWVRIDDGWFTHPKVLRAGKDGQLLYIAALCYANRHETDGRIAAEVLPLLASSTRTAGKRAAAALVAAGLWDATEGGWQIHDFHEYQPTSQDLRKIRQARAEAGRRGGRARQANAKQTPSKLLADGLAVSVRDAQANRNPVPDPTRPAVGVLNKSTSLPRCREGGGRDLLIATKAAEMQAEQANGMVKNRAAWVRAAIESILSEHGDRIARLVQQFPQAPDDVIAAAVNGDTHSLRYYAGGEAS